LIQRGNLGIGTENPTYELDVAGDIGVDEYIYHNGDTNTYLRFQSDHFLVRTAGGDRFVIAGTETVLNEDSQDVNFRVESNSQGSMFFIDGGTDQVGIGAAPTRASDVLEIKPTTATEGFITFDGTSATDESKNVQTTTSSAGHALQGYVKVHVNLTAGIATSWIPVYS